MKLTYLGGHEPQKGRCPIASNATTTATLGTRPTKRLIIDWDRVDWLIIGCWAAIGGLGFVGLFGLFGPVGPSLLFATIAAWIGYASLKSLRFVQCWKSRQGQLLAAIRIMVLLATFLVGVTGTFVEPVLGVILLWVLVTVSLYLHFCGPFGVKSIKNFLKKQKGTTPHG